MASKVVDTVLKWSPLIGIMITKAAGGKMKNTSQRQAFLAAGSVLLQNAIVEPLKKVIPEKRPFPSLAKDSFPSGHTATSFAGAEMLRQEAKGTTPIIAYAGYAFAIATGVMRIKERKHWLRDVLAGAAIGIVSTQLTYRVNQKLFTKQK